jgi:hypothetical protein
LWRPVVIAVRPTAGSSFALSGSCQMARYGSAVLPIPITAYDIS